MASSMTSWLPPLNARRYNNETRVYLSQMNPGSKKRHLTSPMFYLSFKEKVEFDSNYDSDKEPFLGLDVVFRDIQIPFCGVSTERIASELRSRSSLRLTGAMSVTETHFGDVDRIFDETFFRSQELFEKVVNFLCVTTENPENAGANSIAVELSILKYVTVPRDELESWHSWYDEKKRSDPLFRHEFRRAIARPRTGEEEAIARATVPDIIPEEDLLELEEVKFDDLGTKNCCSICFEEFLPDSKPRKLRCNHVFDHDCIRKWLQQTNRCPLCRFNE